MKTTFDDPYIECKNERLLQTMMVITGLMGPMYGILKTNADWLVEQGVPTEDASYLVHLPSVDVRQLLNAHSGQLQIFSAFPMQYLAYQTYRNSLHKRHFFQ